MTREEVIKGLHCCTISKCDECPYVGREMCRNDVMYGALKLIEQGHKILNREDILSEFHEFIFSHVNFFMDAKDENSKSDALSMIIGAAILTHNLLNPKITEETPNANERL